MHSLFPTFKTLLSTPSPPSATDLTADNFASFLTNKVAAISGQFSEKPISLSHSCPTACSQPLSPSFCTFAPLTECEVNSKQVPALLHVTGPHHNQPFYRQ